MKIPLSAPDITDEDRTAVLDVLLGPYLSLGPTLTAFEQAVAAATGARHAIAVNSGTSGLHLCVKAAEICEGDEVITTPFSFVASANCILFEQGTPVFVDIDPETYNLDVRQIADRITPRTKAILPVHVFGRPCDIRSVTKIAAANRLAVIEDACEAIGATVDGQPVGTFGQTGVFAFYPNKQLTTGEGGIIVTGDDEIAALCRSWLNQGRGATGAWLQHERLGYNYRLSDIQCALGLSQIRRLQEVRKSRARVAALYHAFLNDCEEIVLPEPSTEGISWFVYVVRLQDDFSRNDRDCILELLRNHGIGCNNYFTPIHLQPVYRDRFRYRPGDFPVTERVSERTLALPFFNRMTEQEVRQVCDTLREALVATRPARIAVDGCAHLLASPVARVG